MKYCRHDIPEATCGICRPAPRPPEGGKLILVTPPEGGRLYDGGMARVHRPGCQHVEPHYNAGEPYPRREVTEAEAKAAGWERCRVCAP